MSEIILCTGGARSGKSALAEKLAREMGGGVLYIATAVICDEEMEARVKKHREKRPAEWVTWEGFDRFILLREQEAYRQCQTMLLDCMGFMLNNIMYRKAADWEKCSEEEMEQTEKAMISELSTLFTMAREDKKNLILVTNEVGMGLVPADRSSRYYRDILGRANQTAAAEADRVYFMVSGLPVAVKGGRK